jgi:hypothetical protein
MKQRGKTTEAKELLKKALESEGPFVNRKDASSLLTELNASK